MKNIFIVFISAVFLTACTNSAVEKPDNLIDKDKMVNIIYDLSILEAIRLNNPSSLEQRKINPSAYIYKKYKIDSLQFAKSDRYYASDIDEYAAIYDKVSIKLDADKKITDSFSKKEKKKKTDTLVKKTKTDTLTYKKLTPALTPARKKNLERIAKKRHTLKMAAKSLKPQQ